MSETAAAGAAGTDNPMAAQHTPGPGLGDVDAAAVENLTDRKSVV